MWAHFYIQLERGTPAGIPTKLTHTYTDTHTRTQNYGERAECVVCKEEDKGEDSL